MIVWPAKDPQEVVDYSWVPPLDSGDTIATFTATTTSSVVIDSSVFTDTTATVWLSGGTANEAATFTLTATTAGGRTFEATTQISIIDSSALVAFRARYPVFASTPSSTVKLWLDEGVAETVTWPETAQPRAAMVYAAHKLAESGQGSGAIPAGVTAFRSGTFSTSVSDSLAGKTGFHATIYGREYLELMRRYFGGPRLAWTPSDA